jgi:hypothetical protein
LAGVVVLVLAGCGSGGNQAEPVTGRVLYRGAPLTGGTIVFAPDPERGGDGPLAWGEIGPDGQYTLKNDVGEGAVAGWHRVTFSAAPGTKLPSRYSDPARSGQTCEVKSGQANEINFELQ